MNWFNNKTENGSCAMSRDILEMDTGKNSSSLEISPNSHIFYTRIFAGTKCCCRAPSTGHITTDNAVQLATAGLLLQQVHIRVTLTSSVCP